MIGSGQSYPIYLPGRLYVIYRINIPIFYAKHDTNIVMHILRNFAILALKNHKWRTSNHFSAPIWAQSHHRNLSKMNSDGILSYLKSVNSQRYINLGARNQSFRALFCRKLINSIQFQLFEYMNDVQVR